MKFKAQSKIGKAFSRMRMIINEFFEKGYHYSWKLAIYNTAWWVGIIVIPSYAYSFGERKRLQNGWTVTFLINNYCHFPIRIEM